MSILTFEQECGRIQVRAHGGVIGTIFKEGERKAFQTTATLLHEDRTGYVELTADDLRQIANIMDRWDHESK